LQLAYPFPVSKVTGTENGESISIVEEMKDLLIELRKTGEWSYVLSKWSAQIDRELVAANLVERRSVNLGSIRVAYRAVKARKEAAT
jgi:hypothetical protein